MIKDLLENWANTKPNEKAKWLENKNNNKIELAKQFKIIEELKAKVFDINSDNYSHDMNTNNMRIALETAKYDNLLVYQDCTYTFTSKEVNGENGEFGICITGNCHYTTDGERYYTIDQIKYRYKFIINEIRIHEKH